jgi:hypothetical protein
MGTIRAALAEDNVLLRQGVSRLVPANEEYGLAETAPDRPSVQVAAATSSMPRRARTNGNGRWRGGSGRTMVHGHHRITLRHRSGR